MRSLASRVRHVAAHLLHATGVLRLHLDRALRGKAVVLMYHRVVAPAERARLHSHEGMVVDTDVFEVQVRHLSGNFNVLSMEEFLDRLRDGIRFDDRTCVVTFDDGWRDNFTNAFPVLKRHGVPACIFLSTGYVGSERRFWQERLSAALHAAADGAGTGEGADIRAVLEKHGVGAADLVAAEELKSVVDRIVQARKRFGLADNEELLQEIERASPILAGEPPSFFGWEEAREMQQGGISFGCHGESHRILTQMTSEEVRADIVSSKETIERQLVARPRAFSYPNGDYTPETERIVQECGFEAAFTTRRGALDLDSGRFALGRVNIASDMTRCIPLLSLRLGGWS